MRGFRRLCVAGLALALGGLGAASASAAPQSNVCSGSPTSPGVLAGTYASNVTIEGACEVNAGAALVKGNLTVRPGAALVAAFGLNDTIGSGSSSLTVKGNLIVLNGAAMVLGCDAESFACVDDPNQESPTLSSADRVSRQSDRAAGAWSCDAQRARSPATFRQMAAAHKSHANRQVSSPSLAHLPTVTTRTAQFVATSK